MFENLKYYPGTKIKLIFDKDDNYDGYFKLLVTMDPNRKELYLVNGFTFEVEHYISFDKIPLEIITISKLNNENPIDILVDKFLNKKYPLNKYEYEIIELT